MFEIDGSHIAQLNDADLRTLVARLCEAELRRAGLPISGVTAGGHQDAADGGIDVRVALSPATPMAGFIPRAATGFQVKVPKMGPADIKKEMCPNGILRPAICGLAADSGAYIIVSGMDSAADTRLTDRRDAMRKSAAAALSAQELLLDFYDQDRLASWVRQHLGLIDWVRERIGQPIRGWRSYGDWANSGESVDAEYLLDERERIFDCQAPQDGNLTAGEGIRRLRRVLASPKGVVRLVGLSGTGKTRLIQALFDGRIGEQALDPGLAVYADLGEMPEPRPLDLLRHFIRDGQRVIMVVDNCSPETHHALVAACRETESSSNLITVEFDIQDDNPEGTEVFRLEPSSKAMIEALLTRRLPHASQVNRERIAEFSDGNSRVALALADTLRRGESIGRLTGRRLFDRLFRQGHEHDGGLLRAAEACSLLYSFAGEPLEGEGAELPLLAELADMTVAELFRHLTELRSRGLVQRRGPWRAVLPQAIAIRLAHQALERIPRERIISALAERAPERMTRSFCRRLGHLHDSEVARQIVCSWLSPGGVLSDLTELSSLQADFVRNIAPADPGAALDAIERAVNGPNYPTFLGKRNFQRHTWVSLAMSLAYDKDLFQRAALVLLRFVLSEEAGSFRSAHDLFMNLYHIRLSGTEASVEQRLALVAVLACNETEGVRACGLEALGAMLKTGHFMMTHAPDFGARPRGYGLHPTGSEAISWYRNALELAKALALAPGPLSEGARRVIGENFRDLWKVTGVADELEMVARALAAKRFWPEGWVAVRGTIRSCAEKFSPELLCRLQVLEEELRPKDLVQRVRAYIFSKGGSERDIAEVDADTEEQNPAAAYYRVEQIAEDLGRDVARDSHSLVVLLPDLVRGDLSRGWQFGRGLGNGTGDLNATWFTLASAYAATPEEVRNDLVLRGFLSSAAMRDKEAVAIFLDSAIESPSLGPIYPALQASFAIGERDSERIISAIRCEIAPIERYRFLARGPALETISLGSLQGVIDELSSQSGGFGVAVEIFFRFMEHTRRSGQPIDHDIARSGRDLLSSLAFEDADNLLDFRLTGIAAVCLAGDASVECAVTVCRRLHSALRDNIASLHNFESFTVSVFLMQSRAALDEFIGDQSPEADADAVAGFEYSSKNPVEMVPIDALLAWAQISPTARFPRLAAAIDPFVKNESGEDPALKPVASQLLAQAPNRRTILDQFGFNEWPKGAFSRPLTAIFEGRRNLARTFLSDEDPEVRAWALAIDADLRACA